MGDCFYIAMAASRQVTLKLLCMGDSAVGKSNLLMRYGFPHDLIELRMQSFSFMQNTVLALSCRYTDDKFAQDYIATIGYAAHRSNLV